MKEPEVSKKTLKLVKKAAIEIWNNYSDEFGYRSGKINRVKSYDNVLPVYQMFDMENKVKLLYKLTILTLELKKERAELLEWVNWYFSEG